jgi:hypothetical protein
LPGVARYGRVPQKPVDPTKPADPERRDPDGRVSEPFERGTDMTKRLAICYGVLALVLAAGCGGGSGTEQSTLTAILDDRPGLAQALSGHDEVRAWIESRFRTGALPVELMWDPEEPQSGQVAEHEYLAEEGPAVIRIASGASGLDQLAGLIYQLNNIEDYPAFQAIYDAAVKGLIDRRAYAGQMLAQEFEGLQRTRGFLEQHLGDHKGDSLHDNPMYFRILQADTTLEAHIQRYAQQGFDLHTYFEQLYDQEILPKREQG